MKSIFAVVLFAVASFSAVAGTTCSTDSWGNTRCYGTTQDGQQVSTTTTTDSWGNTRTSGTIGGQSVYQTCTTDSRGNTRCN